MRASSSSSRAGRGAAFRLALVLGLTAWVASPARSEGARPSIEALELQRVATGIQVSFDVGGVFSEELLERIHSGVRLSFEHKVVLLGKRMAPLFPRVTLARTVVVTSVRYDSLTQRYDIERLVSGKSWPKDVTPPDSVDRRSTTSREAMEAWMTELRDVPLPDPVEQRDKPLKVRVRTELGVRFLLYFFPWPNAAGAEDWIQP
jgi:hypothetical protein